MASDAPAIPAWSRRIGAALWIALAGASWGMPHGRAGDLVIESVRVFSAASGSLTPPRDVLVRDGRIAGVVPPGEGVVEGAMRLSGRGRVLLPGLIDAHVHLVGSGSGFDDPVPADPRLLASRTLACGVVAVLDLNAPDGLLAALASGGPPRADVFTSLAAITAPGGHGCENGFPCRAVTDAAAARAAVAEVGAAGARVVKIMLDPGGWGGHPRRPRLTGEELEAACDAARSIGLPVVVHAVETGEMLEALMAGADAIAHAPLFGEDDGRLIEAFLSRDAALISTLSAYEAPWRRAGDPAWEAMCEAFVDPRVLATRGDPAEASASDTARTLCDRFESAVEQVGRLHRAGVTILAGTDAGTPGVFHGAALHRELELLVLSGLSPAEAISAATIDAARFLGRSDRIGAVEAGLDADLLLLEEDPLRDVRATRRIAAVIRGGAVVDRSAMVATAASGAANEAVIHSFDQAGSGGWSVATDGGDTRASAERVADPKNPREVFLRFSGRVALHPPSGGFARLALPFAMPAAGDRFSWTGVRFRARAETRSRFRVQVPLRRVRDGDEFGAEFVATPRWTLYRVGFQDLSQIGFGRRERFVPSEVTGIEFLTAVGFEGTFRLDIDDVGLFR